ncbi:MAG: hypothetical protein JNK47_12770 [Mesorhizobium sp.]|nr:hypothetical protein [Mesorhizobium sp.]MBL8578093.1 hypothetical protein [Mesorhizobium sp.]
MTELGIYILGAMALAILAAAGVAVGNSTVLVSAVVASAASYLAQIAYFHGTRSRLAAIANTLFILIAFGAWLYGVWHLV